MTRSEVIALAEKIATGVATDQEIADYHQLLERIKTPGAWDSAIDDRQEIEDLLSGRIWRKIDAKVTAPVRKISVLWLGAIAAAVIAAMVLGVVLFRPLKQAPPPSDTATQRYKNDVPPGRNRAVLTLGNGRTINLDTVKTGSEVASQGSVGIMKAGDGLLAYNNDNGTQYHVQFNIISTPLGGQYKVRLPDGTQVWLNAGSSMRYPVSFAGLKNREVSLTGEAYLEIAKDATQPFIVDVESTRIKVLGTSFDVMAYKDEDDLRTTLIDGAVQVSAPGGSSSTVLHPGQQAQVTPQGRLKVEKDIDLDEVTAWKNNRFKFVHMPLAEIMRQISRWYNVPVVYENGVIPEQHFNGTISRFTNASEVLAVLENTGQVHFVITADKVIVKK